MCAVSVLLPAGVGVRRLATHSDDRGEFTELFRDEWGTGVAPVQWNFVRSEADVVRGVHCHPRHADALIVVAGMMRLGLRDLRPEAPTAGVSCTLDLEADAMQLVTIPPGVAHGFYFPVQSMHVYAVDHAWDPADELGCRWHDPALELDWRIERPVRISARDEALGSLAELRAALEIR
jgi:dTDP-4-dehydrorhamnose 3,5-epimerase